MAVPEDIRAVPRPVNTIVDDSGSNGPKPSSAEIIPELLFPKILSRIFSRGSDRTGRRESSSTGCGFPG